MFGARAGRVDARPLGLFRILFAVVVVVSLLEFAPNLRDFWSDDGVLPRSALLGGVARTERFSLVDACGPLWMLWAYWLLTLTASVALLFGFHARLASVATFVLMAGLYERNTLVLDGSDTVIRVALFWLMFTDSGRCYALDATDDGPKPPGGGADDAPLVPAVGVRLLQLQVLWIYFDAFLFKITGSTWVSGTALHHALQLQHLFARPMALPFLETPALTELGTFAALAFEGGVAFAVFAPVFQPWLRTAALLAGVGLHAGIALLMNVGAFTIVMPVMYALFLEPAWIERLAARFPRFFFPRRWVPPRLWPSRWPSIEFLAPPETRRAGQIALVVLFAFAAWTSLPKSFARAPRAIRAMVAQLSLWQVWDMFSPSPIKSDYRLEAKGKRADGSEVDVLRGLEGGPLPLPTSSVFYSRWTKLTTHLAYADRSTLLPFGRYLCRRWNRGEPRNRALEGFKIQRVERATTAPGVEPGPWKEVQIWDHHCF